MKKQYIIIGFVLLCFIGIVIYNNTFLGLRGNGLTLQETKQFFADTKILYEPPDDKFNRKMKGLIAENPSFLADGYHYPAVNLLKLWSKLGIKPKKLNKYEDEYLFGYKVRKDEKLMLDHPKTKIFSNNNLKIIEITTTPNRDYQYLFFKKQKDNWVYFDHIDLSTEKYKKPKINFLGDNLLFITSLSATGTNLIYYTYNYYRVTDNKLIKLLTQPKEGEWHGMGMLFNREFNSTPSYKDGVLKVDYKIKVTGNNYYYESKVDNEYQTFPLFNVKKEVMFNYNGEELVLDKDKSALSLNELENLFHGGYLDYYKMFKPLFKKLQEGTAMQKEWYEIFKGKIK